ncbi:MAG TPA: hypothetical protein VHN37_01980 [Actinomycetota bacterium]|nr:hypothetical protein [Actinomycetota bacterium]
MTWLTTGNAGTNPASNFLGTTDNQGLTIRTNNQARVTVQSNGNVGIGTITPQRPLHVHGNEVHSGGPIAGFSFGNRETASFTNNAGERWVWYSAANKARLWSGGDKLAVTANGSVGIGTLDPQRPLHVHGHEVHSGGPWAGFSFGNRGTAAFTNNPGERWVWYSEGGVARLWSGVDKIRVTTGGDLQLMGADCAETFDVEGDPEPGTVVVLAGDGAVRASSAAYDTRVAGVVAGAGSYKPGIVLDAGETGGSRRAITLAGKVFCKADADAAPIRVGDLLTTSALEGHVMRVTEMRRALGAVVGKALAPLDSGRGLVPVLMALQ